MDTKRCYVCKQVKSIDSFVRNRTKRDGYKDECKACTNAYRKAYRTEHGRVRVAGSRNAPKTQSLRGSIEERFWRYVIRGADNECWNWTGAAISLKSGRRGVLATGTSKFDYAYRISWKIHRGEIPDGLFVCHHCDNPLCVNPSHLFIGTAKDNTQDMIRKGRRYYSSGRDFKAQAHRKAVEQRRAAGHRGRSTLTKGQVEEIRKLRKEGWKLLALGARFGVSEGNICRIVSGSTWNVAP